MNKMFCRHQIARSGGIIGTADFRCECYMILPFSLSSGYPSKLSIILPRRLAAESVRII